MSKTLDITAKLSGLNSAVAAQIAKRNQAAQVTRGALLARKQADWATCCERHPDHAALIGALATTMGPLKFVRVVDNVGDVIIDSRRYCDG